MKIRLTLLTLIAGLMAFNANAQDNPPPAGSGRPGAPGGAREGGGRTRQAPTAEEIKAHDKNGDGKLEGQEEVTALREARQKEREKKYDANGDGKLDDEEKKKMESENPRRGPGGPGAGGPGFQPTAEEIKTHDKNADGKLEGEELTALRAARQKTVMEKYDTDKDGKLSEEERGKMMEEFRRNRPEGSGRPGGRTRPNADGEKKTDAAPKIPVPGSAPAPASK